MPTRSGSTLIIALSDSWNVNGCNEIGFAFGMVPHEITTTVPASVPVHRWPTAEAASSAASSASSKDCPENIRVVSVVMAKLKFGEIHRQILFADVVICADYAALQEAPERFDVVRVDLAANVFASLVIDGFVRNLHRLEIVVSAVF